MKRFCLVIAGSALTIMPFAQVTGVVPNAFGSTVGGSSFLGPLANAQRTYQLLIHESQLTAFVGTSLNGLRWRIPASAGSPWPAGDITYANYDIYLSGSVNPADRSLTFASNVVGPQTQVRSGSLTIPAGSFPSGGSPNGFGFQIGFDQWLYSGGNLLIEIRHNGSNGTSTAVDAIPATGGAGAGYGTLFSAAWTGNYAGVSGSQGNFAVTELSAVPEPGTLIAIGAGLSLLAARRRKKANG